MTYRQSESAIPGNTWASIEFDPSDLRLCAFLRINLTSKEIALLMGISVRSVENHRYRLRKKPELDPDTDLTEFILTWQNGSTTPSN